MAHEGQPMCLTGVRWIFSLTERSKIFGLQMWIVESWVIFKTENISLKVAECCASLVFRTLV